MAENEKKDEGAKGKVLGFLSDVHTGVENGLKGLVSKRIYVIAALIYLGITGMEWQKFAALCAVACVYIWSETKRKPLNRM